MIFGGEHTELNDSMFQVRPRELVDPARAKRDSRVYQYKGNAVASTSPGRTFLQTLGFMQDLSESPSEAAATRTEEEDSSTSRKASSLSWDPYEVERECEQEEF